MITEYIKVAWEVLGFISSDDEFREHRERVHLVNTQDLVHSRISNTKLKLYK